MASLTSEARPVESLDKEDKLDRFKKWFRLAVESSADQRKREKADLEFQVGENQWSEMAKMERVGRPMLSISLIAQPMQLVDNQANQADLAVKLSPVSQEADEELAEVKQGLYQRIQRDGNAKAARMWGFSRAKICGLGWYRVITQYDEDSDNPSDQEIAYQRILYQDMVYVDPAAEKPDFSDARFIFVAAYVPCSEYNKRYPQAQYNPGDALDEFTDGDVPLWVRGEDPLVTELFYKETTYVDAAVKGSKYSRRKENVVVHRAVLSGCEILEDEPWMEGRCRNFPLIPVIGRELQPVDGKRRWEGMVRPARDGQMTFNYAISSVVEDVSRLSKVPYIGIEGQFEGWENQWKDINRKNIPYMQYRNVNLDGKPAPPPMPMQIDGTKMGLSLQLAQWAESLVQKATAVYEPSLGNFQQGEKGQSGRAIIALQQQADAGTGNYLGNLASISLEYEARVVLELMPIIYDRPGRVTQVLGGEDEPKRVMLNAPYVMNGDTPVAPPQTMPGQPPPQGVKEHKLSEGKYSIAVTVGKSAQTKLQQGSDEIGQILQADPAMMPIIGDIYFRYRDFPGHTQIADRLAKLREQTNPGLGEEKDGKPNPEALAAQNQALQQQVQQMQAELQKAAEAIKTDQAKQQAQIETTRMKAEADQQKAAMDAAGKQASTEMDARLQVLLAQLEQSAETRVQAMEAALAVKLEEMKEAAALKLKEMEMAHDVAMAAAGGRTSKMVRDRGQETGQEREDETSRGESRLPEEQGEGEE